MQDINEKRKGREGIHEIMRKMERNLTEKERKRKESKGTKRLEKCGKKRLGKSMFSECQGKHKKRRRSKCKEIDGNEGKKNEGCCLL